MCHELLHLQCVTNFYIYNVSRTSTFTMCHELLHLQYYVYLGQSYLEIISERYRTRPFIPIYKQLQYTFKWKCVIRGLHIDVFFFYLLVL
jgi:hypothetical protein